MIVLEILYYLGRRRGNALLREHNAKQEQPIRELREVADLAGQVFKILDGAKIEGKQTGPASREYLGPDQIAERLIIERDELRSQVERLGKELAQARKDTERLDWLEKQYDVSLVDNLGLTREESETPIRSIYLDDIPEQRWSGRTFREAIDAAISENA